MVSQRQREARKRFKAENPHLFPKPEPSAGAEGKRKRRKTVFKKKAATSRDWRRGKHPLRVPGMRPGESCFICKSRDHIAKHCPKKDEWEKNKICLLCRRRGHSLKNCSERDDNNDKKYCYNCGQSGHSLSKCPEPIQDGGSKYANCFVCKEQGHLSKNCPKNTHGIYPKGGCCKTCGAVTHLAKDCPNKGSKTTVSCETENASNKGEAWQGKLTVFRSGDDLEDDFVLDTEKNSGKAKTRNPDSNPDLVSEKNTAPNKTKKKSAPKIVNFFG